MINVGMLSTHWGNSFWQVNFLYDTQLALVDRTREVDLPSILAEVNLLLEQLDVPVPHIHIDIRALHDSLVRDSRGNNYEFLAS